MKKKHKYYFKVGKESCYVRQSDTVHEITLNDTAEGAVIQGGEIATFWEFEHQLEEGLINLGYKEGLFTKNIAYVGLLLSGTPITMRTLFDSFDHVGFTEIYLVYEHLALVYAVQQMFSNATQFLTVDFDQEKLAISLISDHKVLAKNSIVFGKATLDRWATQAEGQKTLAQITLEEVNEIVTDNHVQSDAPVLLFGERSKPLELHDVLKSSLGLNVFEIDDYQEKILMGLILIGEDHEKNADSIFIRKRV